MSVTVKLPVGDEPDWETKEAEDDEIPLKSVYDSFAALHSLRQSRNTWLTSIFPKFSSKAKGKHQPEVIPPAHNLRLLAKCNMEIGPHVFQDTSFYEVHYISESYQPAPMSRLAVPNLPVANSSSTTSYSLSTPAVTDGSVSPTLITQVNEAASANPILQNLLQTAASGRASQEQLQTLGLFIQTLASKNAPPREPSTSPPVPPQPQSQTPFKMPDVILEFKENQSERLLIPREIDACDMDSSSDIVLYALVPFGEVDETKDEEGPSSTSSKSPAVIRIIKASLPLRTAIESWLDKDVRGPNARQAFIEKVQSKHRSFPQFRLPEGDLLSQLQQYSSNNYSMRFLKPSANSEIIRPKRVRQRKSVPKPRAQAQTQAQSPVPVLAPAQRAPTVDGQEVPVASKPPPKRRKSASKSAPDIACTICGMKGVPLLRGGRICRSCLYPAGDGSASTSSFRSGIFITTIAPPPSVGYQPTVGSFPAHQSNQAGPSSETTSSLSSAPS